MKKKTKRFGLLLPSSNTTQEPEFAEVLPSDVSLHCARLTLRNIDPESTIKIVEELEAAGTQQTVGLALDAAATKREMQGREW